VSNVVLASLVAGHVYLSFLILHFACSFALNHFKNLAQRCFKCCSLSVSVAVNLT